MDQDIIVSNWRDLQEVLFKGSWNETIQRFRSPYAFRGLSDKDYQLQTRLIRLGGDFGKLEKHLLRNFRKYAQLDKFYGKSVWNWLAVAQHYGLPTRLMDWTYSPLVAMHFATANQEKYGIDGVIWCVDFRKSTELLPDPLKKIIHREESNVFTAEMLDEECKTIFDFDNLAKSEDFTVFLEPPSIDNRIVNQFALFTLVSNPSTSMDDWLEKHSELYSRVIIPAKLKWEVRDKLDHANISERVLFPGLDGLCAWLARHYSPGPKIC